MTKPAPIHTDTMARMATGLAFICAGIPRELPMVARSALIGAGSSIVGQSVIDLLPQMGSRATLPQVPDPIPPDPEAAARKVMAQLRARQRSGVATTGELVELATLKAGHHTEPPPAFCWHETDWDSAVSILEQGFVPGAVSGKGERSHLVFGHPPHVIRQKHRNNYVRGDKPALLKIRLQGLRLLNLDAIPWVIGVESYRQPRMDVWDGIINHNRLPAGYQGFYRSDSEVAILPELATARMDPVLYTRAGRPYKAQPRLHAQASHAPRLHALLDTAGPPARIRTKR